MPKTQSKRLARKLTALRQEAWRRMHKPLVEQHRWFCGVLRRHYGYFGMPHNWRSLDRTSGPMRVTSGKSRVRESRKPGSVRAEPNGGAT